MGDEKVENIIEDNDLKKLLDPKFHLLEIFREKAPGTYRHSKNVSMFCESVALALNLDVDLLNLAGMYHDIGKMNHPEAFSENQDGKNLHDSLDPEISYLIITRHVGDSLIYLLQIPEMPRSVMKMVSQHHGNTVLRYFAKKAKSKMVDNYRYKCNRPSCIESAILMICDCIEATARALASNGELENAEDRIKLVETSVKRLTEDKQIDDVKIGQLRVIKNVLIKELGNIYHKREIYGDEKGESD